MWQQFWYVLKLVRFADIVDIAFVALFIYAVLTWFKRAASRRILVGIALLAVVYFAARAFDLYMTAQLFHAAFAVLLIALVVVFQEDLRRLFERIATLGTLRSQLTSESGSRHLDIIVEVVAELATRRIGALLVLRGLDPLDRHIEGGVVVDGQISKPLLDSIFDPHSMGHDGAVILENDRLRRFGVHLPLSHNLREVGQRGTRHSAALGLSERTDSLVVVVSEERGAISVARQGKLSELRSATELQHMLDQFKLETFPQPTQSAMGRVIRENAAIKGVSLLLACLAWLLTVYGSGTVQKKETLDIEYRNPKEGLVIDENAPRQAVVTFSGLEHAFNLFNIRSVKVPIDLTDLPDGVHTLAIEDEDVRVPANIKVEQIDPKVVTVQLRSVANVTLPVEARLINRPPAGLQLGTIKVAPNTAQVRLWKSQAEATTRVFTEPIDLSKLYETKTLRVPLTLAAEPSHVLVTIEIIPATPPK